MNTYSYSQRTRTYYQFKYGVGHETFATVHISGGQVLAAKHRLIIDEAIASGATLTEIMGLLRSFPNAKPGRKPF